MSTLFHPGELQQFLVRLEKLQPDSHRNWGKLSPGAMLEHCSVTIGVALGLRPFRRSLISYVVGPFAKKMILTEPQMRRHLPADAAFTVKGTLEFGEAKKQLQDRMQQFQAKGEAFFDHQLHPFFGKITGADWGSIMHKHLDHHFRQFGI